MSLAHRQSSVETDFTIGFIHSTEYSPGERGKGAESTGEKIRQEKFERREEGKETEGHKDTETD